MLNSESLFVTRERHLQIMKSKNPRRFMKKKKTEI